MKIQTYREKAGLSQSQLADRAGVSLSTLQKYERGFKNPNKMALETAVKIAAALTQTGNVIVFAHDLLEEGGAE